MAISTVHDWLSSPGGNYQRGIELLKLHSELSAAQRFLFSLPDGPMTRDKLTAALRAVNDRAGAAMPAAPVTRVEHQVKAQDPDREKVQLMAFSRALENKPPVDLPESVLPPSLHPTRANARKYHTEMSVLRGMSMKTPDGMELRGINEKIVACHNKLKACWVVLETYRAFGEVVLPDDGNKAEQVADLMRELQAVRTWLSQRDKKVRSCTPEQYAEKVKRRDELIQLLHGPAQA